MDFWQFQTGKTSFQAKFDLLKRQFLVKIACQFGGKIQMWLKFGLKNYFLKNSTFIYSLCRLQNERSLNHTFEVYQMLKQSDESTTTPTTWSKAFWCIFLFLLKVAFSRKIFISEQKLKKQCCTGMSFWLLHCLSNIQWWKLGNL